MNAARGPADRGPASRARAAGLLEVNRRYYDSLWSGCRLVEPQRFNTWPLVRSLLSSEGRQLEIAPGLRPRLPLDGTYFIDISAPALVALRGRGAAATQGLVTALPFAAAGFDLVCALDIVEHVENDDAALGEITRVLKPGGVLLLSVPLHRARWTAFDDFVGHRRRYEPQDLQAALTRHRLDVERSAVFGMQPKSSRLLDLGMWWLTHQRERALWWYNRVFMPLGLRFQEPLQVRDGLIPLEPVDEVLMVCRRRG